MGGWVGGWVGEGYTDLVGSAGELLEDGSEGLPPSFISSSSSFLPSFLFGRFLLLLLLLLGLFGWALLEFLGKLLLPLPSHVLLLLLLLLLLLFFFLLFGRSPVAAAPSSSSSSSSSHGGGVGFGEGALGGVKGRNEVGVHL